MQPRPGNRQRDHDRPARGGRSIPANSTPTSITRDGYSLCSAPAALPGYDRRMASTLADASRDATALAAECLHDWLQRHHRLFVLTGAGCSTDSGIPDYRGADGAWKRRPPVTYQAFVGDPLMRARYWARSFVGWPAVAQANPTPRTAPWPRGKRAVAWPRWSPRTSTACTSAPAAIR